MQKPSNYFKWFSFLGFLFNLYLRSSVIGKKMKEVEGEEEKDKEEEEKDGKHHLRDPYHRHVGVSEGDC